MASYVRDGSPKVGAVAFLLLREEDGNADYHPSRWHGPVPLSQTLKFHLDGAASKVFRVSICCTKKIFHLLNSSQHKLHCFHWDTKSLEHQRGNCVCYAVII